MKNNSSAVINVLEPRTLLAAGDLDATFGGGGRVLGSSIASYHAPGVVVRGDGRIVVVGTNDRIARYNSDGSLDSTFGTAGYVQFPAGFVGEAETAAAAPGDKFVVGSTVAGTRGVADLEWRVMRFNADGTPDPTFASAPLDFGARRSDELIEVTVQPDGKVVAVGVATPPSGGRHFAVARFNADGSPDATFGSGGKAVSPLPGTTGSSASAVAIQPDGKLVLAGTGSISADTRFAVARYNADGSLEAWAVTRVGQSGGRASDVVVQPDGRVVAVGTADASVALVRYSPQLAAEQLVVTPHPRGEAWARAVRLDVAGRVVVAGYAGSEAMLARYNPDLTRDMAFGTDGWVATDFGNAGTFTRDVAERLFLLPGNRILVAGQRTDNGRFAMARYDAGPLPRAVVGRHAFYNRSVHDGYDARANAADDGAVDPSKAPLFPGQAPSAANVTGYSRGINGVMVDVAGLTQTPAAADFVFEVARAGAGGAVEWRAAPAPAIARRAGAGVAGADRVTLTWNDGAIQNSWLRVTVKATANTGLARPDVFCFGNLAGETGNNAAGHMAVNALDLAAMRRGLTGATALPAAPAGPSDRLDHNRDGVVDGRDLLIVRRAVGGAGLPLLDTPATTAGVWDESAGVRSVST